MYNKQKFSAHFHNKERIERTIPRALTLINLAEEGMISAARFQLPLRVTVGLFRVFQRSTSHSSTRLQPSLKCRVAFKFQRKKD